MFFGGKRKRKSTRLRFIKRGVDGGDWMFFEMFSEGQVNSSRFTTSLLPWLPVSRNFFLDHFLALKLWTNENAIHYWKKSETTFILSNNGKLFIWRVFVRLVPLFSLSIWNKEPFHFIVRPRFTTPLWSTLSSSFLFFGKKGRSRKNGPYIKTRDPSADISTLFLHATSTAAAAAFGKRGDDNKRDIIQRESGCKSLHYVS